MRRAIILAAASLGLAGCGSLSVPGLDSLTPTPPSMTLSLESLPAGAEARTSLGPSCRTPCSVSVPRTENFSVTFTLDRYLPQTVPVRLLEPTFAGADTEGASVPEATFDPNPVYAELQLAPPPKRSKAAPKRRSAPPAATPAAQAPAPASVAAPPPAAAPPASSPFPSPVQQRFPPPG